MYAVIEEGLDTPSLKGGGSHLVVVDVKVFFSLIHRLVMLVR